MPHLRRGVSAVTALLCSAGVVSAHGLGAGTGVPVPVVIGLSALVGTATGLVAVVVTTGRVAAVLSRRQFAFGLGVGLTLLGLSFFLPVVGDTPVFAFVGGGVGVALARWVPHRHAGPAAHEHEGLVAGVVGAIGVHRLFEGVVLAAGFLAGTTVGAVTAVVVTVHAAGETAVVGSLLADDGRPRLGVAAVLVIQAGFVVAALAATTAAVSVPTIAQSAVVTVAAGVLASAGIHECRQCLAAWRATA